MSKLSASFNQSADLSQNQMTSRKGVSTMKRLTQSLLGVALMLTPRAVFASSTTGRGLGSNTLPLPDNLPAQTSFLDLLTFIINFILGFVGTIAVLMLIWGGFRYLTSSGKSDATKDAKNTILYAIIGIVIILLSYAIVNTLTSSLAGR